MEKRIYTTKEAAARLGMPYHTFKKMWGMPGFPKPIIERKHHKFWDFKAIENYFDKASNLLPHSYMVNNRITEALRGGNQGAVS